MWFFNIICSQVTLGSVNSSLAFKTSKCLQLISDTVSYLVAYAQANHRRSWKRRFFKSNFSICERRTGLQAANPRRSTENSTTQKVAFNLSWLRLAHASFFLCRHLFTSANHRAARLRFWEPRSTTCYTTALAGCVSSSVFALLMRNKTR